MDVMTILLKISLVIFMAGNLMEMGLRLDVEEALKGLRNIKFVAHTLIWGFLIGPALALLITIIIPLDEPFAIGMILMGMAPCAPFVPLFVTKAKGDLGYTAAYMILVALGTIIFMPFAVPLMVKGLTISAWAIAKPLLIMILIPLIIGGVIRRNSSDLAGKMQPVVKKITIVFTLIVFVLLISNYYKGIISAMGSLAILSQVIFFSILTIGTYVLGFGLKYEQKIVLSIGNSTRNLGAAIAPLFTATLIAPEAMIMIIISLPVMLVFPPLAIKLFGKNALVKE